MLLRLIAIAKNTFTETLRQPIYAVIIVFSLLLMLLAPAISMYTLDEDIKLLRELGLSTLFLAGLFIAVFASTGAITEEIESGTITTILSKPISRPVFVLGKFFGIAAAVTLAHILIAMALLMVTRHGVLETANDEIDWTVVSAAGIVLLATLTITALMNYAYDWNFPSTGIVLGTVFAGFAILFLSFMDRDWKFNPSNNHFNLFDIMASALLLMAMFELVALAILFSTRFNEIVTLTFCVGIFLLGLISDWVFGRFAGKHLWAKIGTILTPNLQIFWVSDAIYESGAVPASYLLLAAGYTALYTAGILALAIALFQRRQVG
ncbi:MAG: ABC transporter permease [Planctomycetales bacterium]|nr:ABC transporter permease [Planctomycetales bacterium]